MDDRVFQLSQPIILLSRQDLAALMPFAAYVEAVADAFRLHAQGRTLLPNPMHVVTEAGGFHVKAGGLPSGPGYVAFKANANFPNNRVVNGLPTIQGAILLFNSTTGSPVALLDSIEITIKRTGAATAVAARHLARPESRVATIVGCGEQGRIQLEALRHALDLQRVFLFDRDRAAAAALAAEIEVHAEIGEIIDARKSGRANGQEITIFDGTGVGIQDVAAAVRAYELARERGAGTRVDLG